MKVPNFLLNLSAQSKGPEANLLLMVSVSMGVVVVGGLAEDAVQVHNDPSLGETISSQQIENMPRR